MSALAQPVIINGRFLQRPVTGVERFAVELLKALDQLIGAGDLVEFKFSIALPNGVSPSIQFNHIDFIEVGRAKGYFWEQVELPIYCKGRFLINLCNTAPVVLRKQIVVIHDAAVCSVPQAFSSSFRLVYKCMHWLLAKRNVDVLTVSEFSKHDLLRCFPFGVDQIRVMPEGADHIANVSPDAAIFAKNGVGDRPYVLAVSSMAAHKNFKLVLEAYRLLEKPGFDILIAGGANPSVFGASKEKGEMGIKWLGYVSDQQLRALYESASCFVFPSIYEGFGIPPLEAMQCGCPVIASESASIPEICGDAALYFSPTDPKLLGHLMNTLVNDPSQRNRMAKKGYQHVARFTWEKAARVLTRELRQICGGQ